MGIYDDLFFIKNTGAAIDRLIPVRAERLDSVIASMGPLPVDYTSFLKEIGAGEIGDAGYMLYDGLVEPSEIYENAAGLNEILLFGDDFQGFNSGFDTRDWRVVEIDPTDLKVLQVAKDFQSFIRQRIAGL